MNTSRTIRTALVATLLAGIIAAPGSSTASSAAELTTKDHLLAWAADRYAQAGLQLPAVEFTIHDDLEGCGGDFGLHTPTAAGSRIDLCPHAQVDERWILLHELGHAWAAVNLSDEQRAAFTASRGLQSWSDPDARWNERGTEHAAEILAWGLAEKSRLPGRIADHDLASVTEAFQQLTGTEPICDTDGAQSEEPPTETQNRRGGPKP